MTGLGQKQSYQNLARFFDTNGSLITVGGVGLNGSTIPNDTGYGYLSFTTQTYNTYHIWGVSSGGSVIPTFTDSVLAPSSFTITSPGYLPDSVSVSSGFTIAYGSPGTDSVVVAVVYDGQLSPILTSSTDTVTKPRYSFVSNTGSTSISSSMMSGFPSYGVVIITVGGSRFKNRIISGRQYQIRSTSSASTILYLKP